MHGVCNSIFQRPVYWSWKKGCWLQLGKNMSSLKWSLVNWYQTYYILGRYKTRLKSEFYDFYLSVSFNHYCAFKHKCWNQIWVNMASTSILNLILCLQRSYTIATFFKAELRLKMNEKLILNIGWFSFDNDILPSTVWTWRDNLGSSYDAF